MKKILIAGVCAVCVTRATSADTPPADAFRVLPPVSAQGPSITPYLKYQTELAWLQDDQRRKKWAAIQTKSELTRLQQELRDQLLKMLGGLPTVKTPLNPQITGQIQMKGLSHREADF